MADGKLERSEVAGSMVNNMIKLQIADMYAENYKVDLLNEEFGVFLLKGGKWKQDIPWKVYEYIDGVKTVGKQGTFKKGDDIMGKHVDPFDWEGQDDPDFEYDPDNNQSWNVDVENGFNKDPFISVYIQGPNGATQYIFELSWKDVLRGYFNCSFPSS